LVYASCNIVDGGGCCLKEKGECPMEIIEFVFLLVLMGPAVLLVFVIGAIVGVSVILALRIFVIAVEIVKFIISKVQAMARLHRFYGSL
jgi:flagellar biosynthesis protein FlhB